MQQTHSADSAKSTGRKPKRGKNTELPAAERSLITPKPGKAKTVLKKPTQIVPNQRIVKRDKLFQVERDYYTHQVREFEELEEEIIPNSTQTETIEGIEAITIDTKLSSY